MKIIYLLLIVCLLVFNIVILIYNYSYQPHHKICINKTMLNPYGRIDSPIQPEIIEVCR